jgi:hypothetical protein
MNRLMLPQPEIVSGGDSWARVPRRQIRLSLLVLSRHRTTAFQESPKQD